ncbi:DUF2817 domain-containing protein [Streptomyces sp. NPDC051940]|uniref:DUF2817 domain-containing protein n=1 Tax=Streptomyces sp. NPDC051940 TaxID=3155675 RepID=UPI00341A5EB3
MSTPARQRLPRLALVLAAATLLLSITGSAPANPRIPPRTGFESRHGASWTTQPEELSFLTAVRQRSSRVSVDTIGTTRQGRPLRLVRIGEARANVLLLICSQHGDEPAGREACLTTIRDLAFGRDAATRRLLATTTVLVLPTANPDGLALERRTNSENADINRDHLVLRTAEARAIAGVIRDHHPDLVYDLHEYHANEPVYGKDVLSLWPRHAGVVADLHDASESLATDYIRPAAERAGFSTGVYGIWTDPDTGEPLRQVAGDGQERILRNTAGLKHAAAVLVETRINPAGRVRQGAVVNNRRVATQLAALRGALAFEAAEGATMSAASAAAWEGDGGTGPLYLGGADNDPPRRGATLTEPLCGYRLDAEQFAEVRERLALHGIRVRPAKDDGAFVPLRQPLRALVPLLLDKRAAFHLTEAAPLRTCS